MKNKSMVFEFWDMMRIRKKWWLLPTIVFLLLISFLFIFGGTATGGVVQQFIYAMF